MEYKYICIILCIFVFDKIYGQTTKASSTTQASHLPSTTHAPHHLSTGHLPITTQVPHHSSTVHTHEHNAHSSSFWQITDIHFDPLYSSIGNKFNFCHEEKKAYTHSQFNGIVGYPLCDSSWTLIKSAFQTMRSVNAKPDFILWTGGSCPHFGIPDLPSILQVINYLSMEIINTFGTHIPVIPCLGDFDSKNNTFPSNNMKLYKHYLEEGGWKNFLDKSAQKEFINGGYFSRNINSSLMILSLNTNLYTQRSHSTIHETDPSGQFKWMEQKLKGARRDKMKVIITANMPPGFPSRSGSKPFMLDEYNNRLVKLLVEFNDIILGHVFGFEHKDSFRLFLDPKTSTYSVGFLAPPVTPLWFSGPSFKTPSVRLYHYDAKSIVDYDQYRLDLNKANIMAMQIQSCMNIKSLDMASNCGKDLSQFWGLYYKATQHYGIASLAPENVVQLYYLMINNVKYFKLYQQVNDASFTSLLCNDTCRAHSLCAVSQLLSTEFSHCMIPNKKLTPSSHVVPNIPPIHSTNKTHKYITIIILLGVMIVFIILVVTAIIRGKRDNPVDAFTDISRESRGYARLQVDPESVHLTERYGFD